MPNSATLFVSGLYDDQFPETAFYGYIHAQPGDTPIAVGGDETDPQDTPIDQLAADYLALLYALANSDHDPDGGLIIKTGSVAVVAALHVETPPASPLHAALWRETRDALAAANATIRAAAPDELRAAMAQAERAREAALSAQARFAGSTLRTVRAWVAEWDSVRMALEDMWEAIEAHGLHHERPWLKLHGTIDLIERAMHEFTPLLRAYEDTQPLIIGGEAPEYGDEDGWGRGDNSGADDDEEEWEDDADEGWEDDDGKSDAPAQRR